jgi:organic hydroperoxide reductase OsmC/OhrA
MTQNVPHRYSASAAAGIGGDVTLESRSLPRLASAPPLEFGGPGDRWSPETLLVAAVADCFVLTFRAVARAAQLPWNELRCDVVGTLDRVERVTSFTHFVVRAELEVPDGVDAERARSLLERAERTCLITNSLKAQTTLEAAVLVVAIAR